MEHVVFHPGPDGSPAFRRFGSLDESLAYVEQLRNEHGVSEVTVHALTQVPVSFRTVYRAVVPGEPDPGVPPQARPFLDPARLEEIDHLDAVPPVAPVAPAALAEPQAQPEPALAAPVASAVPEGKRSLGFFAH